MPQIRKAGKSDCEDVLRLMRGMQADDPWSEVFDEAVVRANLEELSQNHAYGVIYLAQEAQEPVGYVVICFDYSLEYRGKGAWVDELYVEQAYRGKGIAKQLMHVAEQVAVEHHAKYLHLEVSHGNPAIELYRRRGFVDHQRYLMTKRIGG